MLVSGVTLEMGKHVKYDLLTYSNGGFPSLSKVAKQYQLTNGLLRRVGHGVARTYMPFSEVGLPTALARISTKEITPLEFASEFGELGYSRLVRAALLPRFSACLPKSDNWKTAHAAYRDYRDAVMTAARDLLEGDPVDWIIAQSRTVALCLNFVGLLGGGDEYEILDALADVTRGPYAMRDQIVTLPVKEWREALRNGIAPSVIIRRPLCDLIAENIAGVRRWLITDPHGSRAESFFFGTTIEAAYWQLADKMEAKMVLRCAECKRFFVARDKRQQYCPPLPGSSRSRCSSRLNVKNWRDRHE
jgi:hypothetical protein